jgi:SAM-dependent methyltransferase
MTGHLEERAIGGLHDHLIERVIPRLFPEPSTAIDLGAGSGALAARLAAAGWSVLAVEGDVERFAADVPVIGCDLNDGILPRELEGRAFRLVVSTEVIEHVESPIRFLRSVQALLEPNGLAVLTTPNVDNVLARAKFLATGKLRMMDAAGDPTHISPIFLDLFLRQYLPRSGLRLVDRSTYPDHGFLVSRWWIAALGRLLALVSRGGADLGDNHVFVVGRAAHVQI